MSPQKADFRSLDSVIDHLLMTFIKTKTTWILSENVSILIFLVLQYCCQHSRQFESRFIANCSNLIVVL